MAETQPMNLQALCYTAGEDRQALNGLVDTEGVVDEASGALLVASTAAADHSVTVAAGQAYIAGDDDAPDQGMYWVRNDAVETLQHTAGGGGNNRIDTIIATVRDSEYGGLDNDWVLSVLEGTPNAAAGATGTAFTTAVIATAAVVPDNAIVLGYVRVITTDTLTTIIAANDVYDARTPYLRSEISRWHSIQPVGVPTAMEPAFTNSWVNFGGTTQVVQFRKVGDLVYLRGTMKSGTAADAFTLPVGFRPPADLIIATIANNGAGAIATGVQISSAGAVAPASTGSTYFCLDNIQFSVNV